MWTGSARSRRPLSVRFPPPPPESSVEALFNGEGVYVAMLPVPKGGITADALYKTDQI